MVISDTNQIFLICRLPARHWDVAQCPIIAFHRSGSAACQNRVPAESQLLAIIALGLMMIRSHCIKMKKDWYFM